MADILDKLFAAKAKALVEERQREPLEALTARAALRVAERRSFAGALSGASGPAVIAEIKRASPSVGLIARNIDPASIAMTYERAGADAISVLTETDHFLGDLAYLDVARAHASLPILRKDFLSTRYHVVQTAAYGADAFLAIVAGLSDAQLRELIDEAAQWKLDVLVEVHDEAELARALGCGATILGVNNRDLRTFETSLTVSEELLPRLPAGAFGISESGLKSADDIRRLTRAGARGFLIGEALMRSDDPADFIRAIKAIDTSVHAPAGYSA